MTVQVGGLSGLQAALKEIGDIGSQKEVRVALKESAEIIADDARARVPSRSGKAAGAIRASASGTKAYVIGGKASVRYYGWLDFGSRNPRTGNTRKEGPWRGSGTGPTKGRFLYPAITAKEQAVTEHVRAAVGDVIQRLGLD